MSIMNAVHVPEGIVLAADSRLTSQKVTPGEKENTSIVSTYTLSDNSQKVILLNKVKIGITYCGAPFIEGKTIPDYLRIFETNNIEANDTVQQVVQKLYDHLKGNKETHFFISGYTDDIQYVFAIDGEGLRRMNKDGEYGISWNGKKDAITKMVLSKPQMEINWEWMPLKDAIDYSEFLIDLTIKYERFTNDIQTCGGPIDILVITKDNAFWYKHKFFI